jgi:hypothetical protein
MTAIAPEVSVMSNIVFLKFSQPVFDDPVSNQTDELAQLIQNSGLPDIMGELEAKLGVMLGYLTEFQNISDAEIGRKDVL